MNFPHFKYIPKTHRMEYGCIMLDGEEIHKIGNLEEFHKAFGYTSDMAKTGILPDEFIWDKFIKDTRVRCACLELSFIEYLSKESARFREIYKSNHMYWSAIHAMAILSRKAKCSACKNQPDPA